MVPEFSNYDRSSESWTITAEEIIPLLARLLPRLLVELVIDQTIVSLPVRLREIAHATSSFVKNQIFGSRTSGLAKSNWPWVQLKALAAVESENLSKLAGV